MAYFKDTQQQVDRMQRGVIPGAAGGAVASLAIMTSSLKFLSWASSRIITSHPAASYRVGIVVWALIIGRMLYDSYIGSSAAVSPQVMFLSLIVLQTMIILNNRVVRLGKIDSALAPLSFSTIAAFFAIVIMIGTITIEKFSGIRDWGAYLPLITFTLWAIPVFAFKMVSVSVIDTYLQSVGEKHGVEDGNSGMSQMKAIGRKQISTGAKIRFSSHLLGLAISLVVTVIYAVLTGEMHS